MTDDRHQIKISSLTRLERMAYEATPIAEQWTAQQILQETLRQGVTTHKAQLVLVLNTLAERGLVKTTASGTLYQRTHKSKPMAAAKKHTLSVSTTTNDTDLLPSSSTGCDSGYAIYTTPKAPPSADFMSKLGAMSATLRQAADQMDAIALEIGAYEEKSAKSIERFKQLQTLLKESI